MKWIEFQPVAAGQIVRLTVCGVFGEYRARRAARDVLDLSLGDLEPVTRGEGQG